MNATVIDKAADVFLKRAKDESAFAASRAATMVLAADSLARIAELEAVIREFMRAGLGNSTDFETQRRAYNMAIDAKAVTHTVCETCYPRKHELEDERAAATALREAADRMAAVLIRYRNETPMGYHPPMILIEVGFALAAYRVATHGDQYDGPTEDVEDVMCVACGGTGEAPDNGTNMGECDECCGSGLMA